MSDTPEFRVRRVRVALEPGNGTHALGPAAAIAGRLNAAIEGLYLEDDAPTGAGAAGQRYISRLPAFSGLPDPAAELRALSRVLETQMATLADRLDIPWSLNVIASTSGHDLPELGPEDLLVVAPRSRLLERIMRPGLTFGAVGATIRHPLLLLTRSTPMEHPIVCGTADVLATTRAVRAAIGIAGHSVRQIDLALAAAQETLVADRPGLGTTFGQVHVRTFATGTDRGALALATAASVHDLIVIPATLAGLAEMEPAEFVERIRLPLLIVP
jgi:hypothetical protein